MDGGVAAAGIRRAAAAAAFGGEILLADGRLGVPLG
jgi:hypothetical protein